MALILVVDDSASQMLNMKKILERNKHTVITADNGSRGVEVAKDKIPDLILMDVVMPNLNGFQATREITKNESTKNIPVIMVTTKDNQTDKVWADRQGAKAYLVKPIKEKMLITTINQYLP